MYFGGGVFAAMFSCATLVSAQTTPEAFLDEVSGLYAKQGMSLDIGSQTRDGDTLQVRDLSMTFSAQDAEMTMMFDGFDISEIDEVGYDLEVTFPEVVDLSVAGTSQGIEIKYNMSMQLEGRYLVGGTTDNRTITVDFPSASINVDDLAFGSADIPPVNMSILSTGNSGTIEIVNGDRFTYSGTGDDVSVSFSVDNDGKKFEFNGNYTGLAATGGGPIIDIGDPDALFASAVPTEVFLTTDAGALTATGTGNDGFSFSSQNGAAFLKAMFGKGMVDYSFGADEIKATFSSDALPIPPVEVDIAKYESRFAMPVVPHDEAGLAALLIKLDGVSVSEGLWSLIDPGQSIPRDPAVIQLDVTSTMRALYNMFDPDAMAAAAGQMPFEVDDVQLNELAVRIGGAAITGSGQAEINNSGPFPMPVGGVDFKISGINGLIEKLVGAGILQAEQAMPAQMMLGMFAKPGAAPDEFTSRLEMGADGSITANGIPLQ